jgi:hypothetical protein
VEVDGPSHFVSPGNTVNGPTQYSVRALKARGYTVVSIPGWEWGQLKGRKQQQAYLIKKLKIDIMVNVWFGVLATCAGHNVVMADLVLAWQQSPQLCGVVEGTCMTAKGDDWHGGTCSRVALSMACHACVTGPHRGRLDNFRTIQLLMLQTCLPPAFRVPDVALVMQPQGCT